MLLNHQRRYKLPLLLAAQYLEPPISFSANYCQPSWRKLLDLISIFLLYLVINHFFILVWIVLITRKHEQYSSNLRR